MPIRMDWALDMCKAEGGVHLALRMLVGRKAAQVENGAEEEWEKSGLGPQAQNVESIVNACVMRLKFGDQWKFFTRGGGAAYTVVWSPLCYA